MKNNLPDSTYKNQIAVCNITAPPPPFAFLGYFYNNFVQTRHIQSKLLLMYKNISYDVDLPSEFPQHSEFNKYLIVRNASLHRTRGNLCAS